MGKQYNKRESIKLVPTKKRYPGLKPMIKARGLTFKSIYLQFDRCRPDQFSQIISGSVPEISGFLEALLGALENLGVHTTEEELRGNPEEKINI